MMARGLDEDAEACAKRGDVRISHVRRRDMRYATRHMKALHTVRPIDTARPPVAVKKVSGLPASIGGPDGSR